MNDPRTAPYGAWRSPITADLIVADTVPLGQIAVDGDTICWSETRASEEGRSAIVRRGPDGATAELTPAPFNARTRVHEYGGGAFVVAGGTLWFSNFDDGRLYRRDGDADGPPRPIAAEAPLRYADLTMDALRGRLIGVREDHSNPDREAVNTLVAVAADGDPAGGVVLVAGADFYAAPRLSPDGGRLAWVSWNHPNMPWDGTELWVAPIGDDGALGAAALVAGGANESVFQPEWSPDGVLHFVSDRSGWWNLYRDRADGGGVEPLLAAPMAAEFGQPLWLLGITTYGFAGPTTIACAVTEGGQWRLATLDTITGVLTPIATPFTEIDSLKTGPGWAVARAGGPRHPAAIVRFDLAAGTWQEIRSSSDVALDPGTLSMPRPIAFSTENGLTAHAFYYPPTNRDYAAPAGERPPLLVQSHGGPTSGTSTELDLEVQFWTSRGFGVLDVNYGGSTGYGRAYRQRLDGQWGVVDVDDCVNGARFLADRGEVDPARLAIRGWSASGYTTLAALTFRDVFQAGASHFGISDLETMTRDTHKFESRYLDRLIGPYPAMADLYRERSPIHFTDRLSAPMILFQGLEDKVVPPDQAEAMYEAVRAKGLPVAYVPFAGEQHGFRRAESIIGALEGELYFYARVFGFDLPDPIAPIDIANLPAAG